MENFNKNWLAILLVAVVFGTLGFLVGRTTGQNKRMMRFRSNDGKDFSFKEKLQEEDDDDTNVEVTVKMDTLVKDGKQIIVKEVKKTKKN